MTLRRKLAVVALVYVIEGFPMGMFLHVWPVYLRGHDVSLTVIGWLSGLSLAWSFKVLWSPLVDRFGERRRWIAASLLAMVAALVALAGLDPRAAGIGLFAALCAYCFASATQDVAIDAYTIGIVDPGEEGPANAVRVGAYRVGLILAGGGLLFLPRWIGWNGTFLVSATLSAAMAASALACPRASPRSEAPPRLRELLGSWPGREGMLAVLGFVLLYRVGDRAMGPMIHTFWVDRGFAYEEIGAVSTTLGALATLAGAALGGGFVSRRGIGRALLWLGVLALTSNLAYAAAAALPASGRPGVYAAALVESFCGGLATAAFLSFLMRICEREHAAVQYALLTAVYALAGSAVAMTSGWITQRIGYAAYFALTALYALPAFAFLPGAQRWIGPEAGSTPEATGANPATPAGPPPGSPRSRPREGAPSSAPLPRADAGSADSA